MVEAFGRGMVRLDSSGCQTTFGRSMKTLAPIPKSQVCPFQVFNKGKCGMGRKSARRRKSRSSTTRKYRCLLQRRGAGGGVGFSCDIRSYRIACRIKFWPACLLLGHSLDRLPSVAMLEQSQDPSKRRSPGNTSCQGPIAQRGHPPQPLFYTTSLLP